MSWNSKFLPFNSLHNLNPIPQMAPMNWFLLFCFFTLILFFASNKLSLK